MLKFPDQSGRPSAWLLSLSLSLSPAHALAQDVTAGLAAAHEMIANEEWDAALAELLTLQHTANETAELQQLAAMLTTAGSALRTRSGERAVQAFATALAIRRRLAANGDDPDVAKATSRLAHCLDAQGRLREALPHFEAALSMQRRLHDDRDHIEVAKSLNDLVSCLRSSGRPEDALSHGQAALAMCERLFVGRDHLEIAVSLDNVAGCLASLGRPAEALPLLEASLELRRRLAGDRDDGQVALGMQRVAECLSSLARETQALPLLEDSLAMFTRLHATDHPDVAALLQNVGASLATLGRHAEALSRLEASLAMQTRLWGERDHPDVAKTLTTTAECLESLGRSRDAWARSAAALAMNQRLYGGRDHPEVAAGQNRQALGLAAMGRMGEALPLFEMALSMQRRRHEERDHQDVAMALNNLAACLKSLGRVEDALPLFEATLAMQGRLRPNQDHDDVARCLGNVALCLCSLGRLEEAQSRFEIALTMTKRLHAERDHPAVASALNNVAGGLLLLDRPGDALPYFEASLAMRKRQFGDRDSTNVARSLNNLAGCLRLLGKPDQALPMLQQSLAMRQRLYGDHDHADVASGLQNVADCLQSLDRNEEAVPLLHLAVAMIERLRDDSRTSSLLRQSLFDDLKSGGAFEKLQALTARLGRPTESLDIAERGRGRELLDLLEQQRLDALAEATLRARRRGDEVGALRLEELHREIEGAELDSDRLLHALTRLDDDPTAATDREARRASLLAESQEVGTRRRQLLDERARLLGDVLPVGRVRTAAEIRSALRDGELLLEFTVTKEVGLLYVLAKDGDVEAIVLPNAHATVLRVLPELLRRNSHAQLTAVRGRNPEPTDTPRVDASPPALELFRSLIPPSLWPRLQAARRVFVAPHRELHRLPFELLTTDSKGGQPVHWLDNGPPITYVPSGSVLHWLRQRGEEAGDDATSFDLLVIGDPSEVAAEPEVPERGVFVRAVADGGEGARIGLLPRDVLLRYDGHELVDDKSLRDVRTATDAAIEDGKRPDTPILLEVWRRGETLRLEARKGALGIQVGPGKARAAHEASLGSGAQLARITRTGDLERLRKLPPLKGARAETEAIEKVFSGRTKKTKQLLGSDATEPSIFDLSAQAKYLHFACHGIAEEYAGQSFSMLVLSQPRNVLPGDDGLLKLGDLLGGWRGRLSSCRLVVLSACRTNVGPTFRDEAPQALPTGFLFAGVPAVISSLWAVDDASTRELMTDFYSRLLAGETDKLAAFTAAKKALRAKHPDPFHWAPFLYIGAPD